MSSSLQIVACSFKEVDALHCFLFQSWGDVSEMAYAVFYTEGERIVLF